MEKYITREALKGMVVAAQGDWTTGVKTVLVETEVFAKALGRALGEISRAEAVDALKAFAADAIENLR